MTEVNKTDVWEEKIPMEQQDTAEDQTYTMGRLIAGARKKRGISLEELSVGILSASDLKQLEENDECADKTTWDFLLGRLGISPLIYECYVEKEEYDLYRKRKEMRMISNEIMKLRIQDEDHDLELESENDLSEAEKKEEKKEEKLHKLAKQLGQLQTEYERLFEKTENPSTSIHQMFLANMNGYRIQAKRHRNQKNLVNEQNYYDELKCSMEESWNQFYMEDVFSWISKSHKIGMAVYEQEMLFLLAQGYEETSEIEKAIQLLKWLWEQRKKNTDPEEKTRILSFVAWKLARLEWNRNQKEKAIKICEEAIEQSIQAESFRGLLPLLRERLSFEKQLKWNQEEWQEQEKTIRVIEELFEEFQVNPYGLFVLTTFENARIADEIIRIRRQEQKLTQAKLSEGILEPESYSRFECGKRKLRWNKKKQLLERLGERGNKASLLLESTDPDVVEEYQRVLDHLYKTHSSNEVKLMVYQLEDMLYMKSQVNRQFIKYIKESLGIYYLPLLNQKDRVNRNENDFKESVLKSEKTMLEMHCWSRTRIAIIKGIAKSHREKGDSEIAISILRKAIESFDKEIIGQENASLGKQLLWETLATYLGDVGRYEEAIFYAKKGIKTILEGGSEKGISKELYEIAWNEREKGQLIRQIYRDKYSQAIRLSFLFNEKDYLLFLKGRENMYL